MRTLRQLRFFAVCLAVLPGGLSAAFTQEPDVPVTVPAGDGQMANCAGGLVTGLNPRGDGFLAVRSGPGTRYRVLDRIHNGQEISICDGSGDWVGIVYSRGSLPCKTEVAKPAKTPYRGPCVSGWAHRHWIEIVAG